MAGINLPQVNLKMSNKMQNGFLINDRIISNSNPEKYNNLYGQIISISENKETGENVYFCKDLENKSQRFWVQHNEVKGIITDYQLRFV